MSTAPSDSVYLTTSAAAVQAQIANENEPTELLEPAERVILGLRLTLALAALCLLIVAGSIHFFLPAERGIADLVAGVGAALVAIPVFVEAWASLRHPSLHGITDRLVALALVAAWATGDLMTAAFLPIIMTLGHVLEERSMLGSHEAVKALRRLTDVDSRRLKPDGSSEMVASTELKVGDLVELRAGERVPADGLVRRGSASLDLASLTGESVPVEVTEGDQALAGGMNLDGLLQIELTRVGEESTIGRIIALMREAENAKPPVTRLLDKLRGTVHGVGAAHSRRHLACQRPRACHAGRARGVLPVRAGPGGAGNGRGCDRRRRAPRNSDQRLGVLGAPCDISSVIFDKTGTITTGDLHLAETRPAAGVGRRPAASRRKPRRREQSPVEPGCAIGRARRPSASSSTKLASSAASASRRAIKTTLSLSAAWISSSGSASRCRRRRPTTALSQASAAASSFSAGCCSTTSCAAAPARPCTTSRSSASSTWCS